MQSLPVDILMVIAFNLETEDIFNFCRTSKHYMRLGKNPYFWREIITRDFPDALTNVLTDHPLNDYFGLFLFLYGMRLHKHRAPMYHSDLAFPNPNEERDPRYIQMKQRHCEEILIARGHIDIPDSLTEEGTHLIALLKQEHTRERQKILMRYPPSTRSVGANFDLQIELEELDERTEDGLRFIRQQHLKNRLDIDNDELENRHKEELYSLRRAIFREHRDRYNRFINNHLRARPIRYIPLHMHDCAIYNRIDVERESIKSLPHKYKDYRDGDLIGLLRLEDNPADVPIRMGHITRDSRDRLQVIYDAGSDDAPFLFLTDEYIKMHYDLPFTLAPTEEQMIKCERRIGEVVRLGQIPDDYSD